MKSIKLLDLFSGTGGFALGLQQAGFTITQHQFSEIDKHAIANYKYNFKNAEYVGSVTDVRGQRGQADIITFGSPCQDFSLAGKRKGMEGQRSSLVMEAIRLISEIKPSVFIWENVKGTFSSNNGADFWAILNAFTNIGNYRLEWQLLNTSWFLPQNRERIYLVGHLANRSKPGVFPIGNSYEKIKKNVLRKPKKREWFQSVNCSTTISNPSREGNTDTYVEVQPVLTPNRKEKRQNGRRFKEPGEPSFTLNCQDQQGVMITGGSQKTAGKMFNKSTSLTEAMGKGGGHVPILNQIRKLTEIECERLQGFPDNWTKYGNYDGEIKEISKTQRYKMIGNAVTVDVVKAAAQKLIIKNL